MSSKNYLDSRIEQAMEKPGEWMATATGWFWFLQDPDPRDVHIVDVAFGLARQSRYGGQFSVSTNDYVVSEHSRLMDEYLTKNVPLKMREKGEDMMLEDRLEVLLHDAPEHLFGDMITPMKAIFTEYRAFENMHHKVVRQSFIANNAGIMISAKDIKEIDVRIRADEREAIILDPAKTIGRERLPWVDDANGEVIPLGVEIQGNMSPFEARMFIERFIDIVENVPPRLTENGPQINSSLRRHYAEACNYIGRDPALDLETGLPRFVAETSRDTEAELRAEEFASRIMSQAEKLGPDTLLALKRMIDASLEAERAPDHILSA